MILKLKILSSFILTFLLFGCGKVDPYEGFKAYYFGDYQTAFKIYSQACEEGDAFMCYSVGGMFENGLSVQKDLRRAYKYYLQACQNGISQACVSVAKLYNSGEGIRYNSQKALEYYLMACDRGLSSGCYSAGAMYYNKEGDIPEDKTRTKELFGKACDLGDTKGCAIYKKLNEAGF